MEPAGLPEFLTYFNKDGHLRTAPNAGGRFLQRPLPSPYRRGFTNSLYQVVRTTNYNGILLPLEALYLTFWVKAAARSSNDLWVHHRFRVRPTNFFVPQETIAIPPPLPGPTVVTEARFLEHTNTPKNLFYYMRTNRFLTLAEARRLPVFAQTTTPPPLQPSGPRFLTPRDTFLLLLIVFSAFAFFAYRRRPPPPNGDVDSHPKTT
ncbi:MAG: hypothetical protein D6766_08265 [Verrucomicrobia bacterium]|nr:MAG: hypothetical protein D6766_08265 [Verrucomicrobiota bacterium]